MKMSEIPPSLITQPLILQATLTLLFIILVFDCFSQATTVEYIRLKNRNKGIITVSAPPRLNDAGNKMIVNTQGAIEIYKKSDDGEWLFFEKLPFVSDHLVHFGNDLVVTESGWTSLSYSNREDGFWTKPKTLDSLGDCLELYQIPPVIIFGNPKRHKNTELFRMSEPLGIAISSDLTNYYFSIGTKWWHDGLLSNVERKKFTKVISGEVKFPDSLTRLKIHFFDKRLVSTQSCQMVNVDGEENEKWPFLLQDKKTLLFTKEVVEWINGKAGYKNKQYVIRRLSNGTWSVPKKMPDENLTISWFNRTYDTAYFFERSPNYSSANSRYSDGRIGYAVYPGGLFEPSTDQKALPEKSSGKKEQKNGSIASSKDIAVEATPERKIALVIGVKSYKHVQPLLNSLNDAHDVAASLKAKGFRVMELYDPSSKRQMQDTIRKYFSILNGQRNMAGLFFYSGHGLQVDGSNYLIPTTANPVLKADIDDQCLKMDYVMATLEQAGNPLNIFIMDACRNNPFRSFTRSTEPGLSQVNAPNGSYIVYATSPGKVASDGVGRNGLFTSKLLKHMDTPGLNIEQVFKLVARDVSTESNGVQLPWLSQSYFGDFYFSEKPSVK
jgi:Caspase domain